jgi:hypothetical protein
VDWIPWERKRRKSFDTYLVINHHGCSKNNLINDFHEIGKKIGVFEKKRERGGYEENGGSMNFWTMILA